MAIKMYFTPLEIYISLQISIEKVNISGSATKCHFHYREGVFSFCKKDAVVLVKRCRGFYLSQSSVPGKGNKGQVNQAFL